MSLRLFRLLASCKDEPEEKVVKRKKADDHLICRLNLSKLLSSHRFSVWINLWGI